MAGALIRGLVRTGTVPAERILAADPDAGRRGPLGEELGIRTSANNAEAIRRAHVVVLATKPQVFAEMLPDVSETLREDALVISIAAGVSTRRIEGGLPEGTRVVRAMPNTPALVGAGATAIAGGSHATENDLSVAESMFQSVGICVRVPEQQLDAVTALSGSGPAYVFLMIEALRDAGVREGLPEDVALTLTAHTVLGAAQLLLSEQESPEALRERVTSPGGTTRAGLDALEAGDFVEDVAGGVRAAARRSAELAAIAEDSAD